MFRSAPVLLLLLGMGLGCSQPKKLPELYSVKGQVSKSGEPVNGGFLIFQPRERPEGLSLIVNSEVDQNGGFELHTIPDANVRRPGAPKGLYDVTYTPPRGSQKFAPVTIAQPVDIVGEDAKLVLDLGESKDPR